MAGVFVNILKGFTVLWFVVGWIILLGGTSAVCKEAGNSCGNETRFEWWLLIFQVLVIAFAIATEVFPSFHRGKLAASIFLGIAATLFMSRADSYVGAAQQSSSTLFAGSDKSRYAATAAGCVFLTIANMLAILLLTVAQPNSVNSSVFDPTYGTSAGATAPKADHTGGRSAGTVPPV